MSDATEDAVRTLFAGRSYELARSARTSHYSVGYGVSNYQEFAARRVGSVIPMKLQACDVADTNPSRSTLFGGAGGYIFNVDANGLTTGTYGLNFRIGSDPAVLSVPFELR